MIWETATSILSGAMEGYVTTPGHMVKTTMAHETTSVSYGPVRKRIDPCFACTH